MQFKPFGKIPRLFRDIVITEKLDGSNASIYITNGVPHETMDEAALDAVFSEKYALGFKDGMHIYAGSRNRWVTPGKEDNMGFASWVKENAKWLFELGHGHHFGEWWGKGIQRGYGLNDKRFSLFNTHRWGNHETPEQIQGFYDKFHCYVVPQLYEGFLDLEYDAARMNVLDRTLSDLQYKGSVAAPGFMKSEGIILYHKAADALFKVLLENDDTPKSVTKMKSNDGVPGTGVAQVHLSN